jgi:dTDP-4-dehydrorhamnose reductase
MDVKRILLIGKDGQIGWELSRTLQPLGNVIVVDKEELDLANPDLIRNRVREIKPDIIVNAAAYTAVDKAEEEPELATAINGVAPGILAEEACRVGAILVHYSTDYIFDGNKKTPYTEEDEPNPSNVYGKTKLEGECAIRATGVSHLIFRTSWVYGLRGNNFLLTILRLAREQPELRIVNDQTGVPNWSRFLAEATAVILSRDYDYLIDRQGTYNLSATGITTWYGFACRIIEQVSYNTHDIKAKAIHPIATANFPTLAVRPLYSVLNCSRLQNKFNVYLPTWEKLLELVFNEYR